MFHVSINPPLSHAIYLLFCNNLCVSEKSFSWICTNGEVVGVVVGLTVGKDDGHNDAVDEDVGGVVARNSRRKRKWIRIIVQIIVRM